MPANRLLHKRCGHSEKVSRLTGDGFRTWVQFLLSADDFGVMEHSPAKLCAENYALQQLGLRKVDRLLETVITTGLVCRFEHQGRPFLYQPDWQDFQHITWPATTLHPRPPVDACSAKTQALVRYHPGGQRLPTQEAPRSTPAVLPASARSTSVVLPTSPRSTSDVPQQPARMANTHGLRLTAHGSEGEPEGEGRPPWQPEAALHALQEAYPQQRVTYGYKTETAFLEQLGASAPATAARMATQLEAHKRSHEWRVKGMIPALDRWLREGHWQRTLPEEPPAGEQLAPRTARTLAAAAAILRGDEEP